jgi:hypothetical protein
VCAERWRTEEMSDANGHANEHTCTADANANEHAALSMSIND